MSGNSEPVLVIGDSDQQGGAVARELLRWVALLLRAAQPGRILIRVDFRLPDPIPQAGRADPHGQYA